MEHGTCGRQCHLEHGTLCVIVPRTQIQLVRSYRFIQHFGQNFSLFVGKKKRGVKITLEA